MKGLGYIILLYVFSLLITGCAQKETNLIEGVWKGNNTEFIFHEDGTFEIISPIDSRVGTYQFLSGGKSIMLASTKNRVLRRIVTRYSVSADGKQLALDKTFTGTVVLKRQR